MLPSVKPALPDAQTRVTQLNEQGYSLLIIARILWKEGYRPEKAAAWHNQAVSRLLSGSDSHA